MNKLLEDKIEHLICALKEKSLADKELKDIVFGKFNHNQEKVEIEFFNNGKRKTIKIPEISIEDDLRSVKEKKDFLTAIVGKVKSKL
jgi:hypothetical protein